MAAIYYIKSGQFIRTLPCFLLSLKVCLDCDCEDHEHLLYIHGHLICNAVPAIAEFQAWTGISGWYHDADKKGIEMCAVPA